MRTGSRALGLLGLLVAAPLSRAYAAADLGAVIDKILDQLPQVLGHEPTVQPRAVPAAGPDGPTVNLARLDDPVRLERQLRGALGTSPAALRLSVPGGIARLGDFSVGSSESLTGHLLVLKGDVDVFGRVAGNVEALDGNIIMHQGAVVAGDAVAIGGRVRMRGGVVQGDQRSLGAAPVPRRSPGFLRATLTSAAGLAGVLAVLVLLSFGVVLFAQPQLETVSDTVTHSVFRSFLTGLLAQIVAIPTFGMVITGLVLSVVGLLLVPFVVLVFPLLLAAACILGFLAVTHAIGETRIRRRMAAGALVGSANSYRYIVTGLAGVSAVWIVWILFGRVPIAGGLILGAAIVTTWLLATIGLGAALLSRGGIKPAFAGRYLPPEALTDEYLWATPRFGVKAVERPAGHARRREER